MIENEYNSAIDSNNDVMMPSKDSKLDNSDENDTASLGEALSFADLGLDEITLKAVERKGFVTPSPIQILAIPRLLNGDANVIARARTGTGKTAAFGLPLTQRIREQSDHVRAIILEPTRELAVQTCNELQSFTQGRYPRTCVVYGGASYSVQMRELKRGVEIVVGTPGRVQDHLRRGVLDISRIDYFILDEGDEMLDMGFIDDIENIFKEANPDCRVLLFSATVPPPILLVAQKFMGEYEVVEEEGAVNEPLLIEQYYWVVREREKINALVRLIDGADDFYGLIFTQTKNDADFLCRALDERGYDAAALHGDVPQGQREKILARFRARRTRVLVATDVAARGIDITGLSHVVNYSLPFDGATYVHRIGRTGRAGAAGIAITFVRPEERRRLRFIESAIRKSSKGKWSFQDVPSADEVLKKKSERLFKKLELSVEKGLGQDNAKTEQYKRMAKKLCEDRDAQDVLACMIAETYADALDRAKYGEVSKANAPILSRSTDRTRRGGRGEGWGRRGDWSRKERSEWQSDIKRERQYGFQGRNEKRDQRFKNENRFNETGHGNSFQEGKHSRQEAFLKGDSRGKDEKQNKNGRAKSNQDRISNASARDIKRSDDDWRDDARRKERRQGGGRASKFLYGGYAESENGKYPFKNDARYASENRARPRVHTPTERSASSGLYRQKNKKPKERF